MSENVPHRAVPASLGLPDGFVETYADYFDGFLEASGGAGVNNEVSLASLFIGHGEVSWAYGNMITLFANQYGDLFDWGTRICFFVNVGFQSQLDAYLNSTINDKLTAHHNVVIFAHNLADLGHDFTFRGLEPNQYLEIFNGYAKANEIIGYVRQLDLQDVDQDSLAYLERLGEGTPSVEDYAVIEPLIDALSPVAQETYASMREGVVNGNAGARLVEVVTSLRYAIIGSSTGDPRL